MSPEVKKKGTDLEEELLDPKQKEIPSAEEVPRLRNKKGRPRKGTRLPTRKSERVEKKRNQI